MTKERRRHDINALRTQIAFLYGDFCHGGPDKRKEIERLQQQIKDLEAEPIEDPNPPRLA